MWSRVSGLNKCTTNLITVNEQHRMLKTKPICQKTHFNGDILMMKKVISVNLGLFYKATNLNKMLT